jgi:hypothetical protein
LTVMLAPAGSQPIPEFDTRGILVLRSESLSGQWFGYIQLNGTLKPLDFILLPGPEMAEFGATETWRRTPPELDKFYDSFSRTIAAVGSGDVWQRMTTLSYAIIGSGRTGSLLAHTLSRMGIGNHLILIDPKTIESSNIPDMEGVSYTDVGRPKADLLASHIRRHMLEAGFTPNISAVTESFISHHDAALPADVWISTVDDDSTRLVCAILGSAYHKVILDIGTAIREPRQSREMGADIRLILPGHMTCLQCFGGFSHGAEAIERLVRPSTNTHVEWWQHCDGSLRPLNMLTVGYATQILIDLICGRIQHSLWAQLLIDENGRLHTTTHITDNASSDCAICARAGIGDDVLP